MAEPRHHAILIVDVEGSGRLSPPAKLKVREDLYALLDSARSQSRIDDGVLVREDRGDGVLCLVPADVPIRRLADPFLAVIDDGLAARRVDDTPLRLRLVLHHGEVVRDPNGWSGPALDQAFAMIDSPQLREALRQAPRGRIAVALPDDLYRSIISGEERPDPTSFRMRRLDTKYGSARTWVTVTGAVLQPGGPAEPAAAGVATGGQPTMPVHNDYRVQVGENSGVVGAVGRDANFGRGRG